MSKCRVLQVVPDFSLGGAERLAVYLTTHLDPARFEVATVSLYDPAGTDLDRILEQSGHRVWYLGKQKGIDASTLLAVDRVIRQFRPQVVHTHTISLRYALPSTWLRRVPAKLHTIHSLADKEAGRWVWLRKLAFGIGVTPVAIADEVRESVRRVYGIADCPNIPNGIPVDEYARPVVARGEWRRREGFEPDEVIFVSVGRLDHRKNHALLLEAFSSLRSADTRARLLIVGDDPSGVVSETLERRSRELELGDSFRLLGRRFDIPDLLAASDVFALSSDFEGNPLTVMEAMAAGRAVISTAVGGVPELVEEGVTGLLVERRNATELTAAMKRLLDSSALRDSMGRAGRNRATERFDVATMARAYEELYLSMLAQ